MGASSPSACSRRRASVSPSPTMATSASRMHALTVTERELEYDDAGRLHVFRWDDISYELVYDCPPSD